MSINSKVLALNQTWFSKESKMHLNELLTRQYRLSFLKNRVLEDVEALLLTEQRKIIVDCAEEEPEHDHP